MWSLASPKPVWQVGNVKTKRRADAESHFKSYLLAELPLPQESQSFSLQLIG